jgi:hypothetical protein
MDPEEFPSLPEQAANFASALNKHAVDGFSHRTNEEAENIFETICKPCEHFRKGRCKICGCHLAAKTAWKTAHCPIGKW